MTNKVVTKREIYTLKDDDINTEVLEVVITQEDGYSGAIIEFTDKLKIDHEDLLSLANLVKMLIRD